MSRRTASPSVAYLRSFPLDKVKIDRSFVAALGADPSADAIVRAMVQLASGAEAGYDWNRRYKVLHCCIESHSLVSGATTTDAFDPGDRLTQIADSVSVQLSGAPFLRFTARFHATG